MKNRAKADYKQLKKRAKQQPQLFARLAQLELELGKPKQALDRLRAGLRTAVKNPTVHYLIGLAERDLNEQEASLTALEECLQLDPLHRRARQAYADLLHDMGRLEQEEEARAQLYETTATNPAIEDAQRALLLARIREHTGQDTEWDERWHPGDFTANGALARAAVRELQLGLEPAALPEGLELTADETRLTQMMARLPMGGVSLEEARTASQGSRSSESQPPPPPAAPVVEPELDEEPAVDQAEPAPPLEPEPVVEPEPLPVEEVHPAPAAPAPVESVMDEPAVESEPEAAKEADGTSTANDAEDGPDEPVRAPTKLEAALTLSGESLDDFVDLELLLETMSEEPDPLVVIPEVNESVTRQADEVDLERLQAELAAAQAADEDGETDATEAVTAPAIPEAPAAEKATPAEAPEAPEPEAASEPAPTRQRKQPSERNVLSQDALSQLLQSFNQAETASPEAEAAPASPTAEPAETDSDAAAASHDPTGSTTDSDTSDADTATDVAPPTTTDPPPDADSESPAEDTPPSKPTPSGPMSQELIDSLIKGEAQPPAETTTEPPAAQPEPEPDTEKTAPSPSGPLNQDMIDSLIKGKPPPPAEATTEQPATSQEPAADQAPSAPSGPLSQDLIDSLFKGKAQPPAESSAEKSATEPEPKPEPQKAAPAPSGPMSQELIDSLIKGKPPPAETTTEQPAADHDPAPKDAPPAPAGPLSQDLIDSLMKGSQTVPAAPEETTDSGISGEEPPANAASQDAEPDDQPAPSDIEQALSDSDPAMASETGKGTSDIDGWLNALPDHQASADVPSDSDALDPSSADKDTAQASSDANDSAEPTVDDLYSRLEDLDRDAAVSTPSAEEPAPDSATEMSESTPAEPAQPATPPIPVPSGPPPRRQVERSTVADELPPEEYRGPVSKTLIKLQIKQGKLDHARAMLAKFERLHPEDPATADLAAELEQAAG